MGRPTKRKHAGGRPPSSAAGGVVVDDDDDAKWEDVEQSVEQSDVEQPDDDDAKRAKVPSARGGARPRPAHVFNGSRRERQLQQQRASSARARSRQTAARLLDVLDTVPCVTTPLGRGLLVDVTVGTADELPAALVKLFRARVDGCTQSVVEDSAKTFHVHDVRVEHDADVL